MRITIELDGNAVHAVDVGSAVPAPVAAEPPAELVAAARRLGADSAGMAAFSMPAGPSTTLGILAPNALAALDDVDAGKAAGEFVTVLFAAKTSRTKAAAKKSTAKVNKTGR